MKALHAQLNPKPFNVEDANSRDTLLTTCIDMDDETQAASETDTTTHQSRRVWPILATTGGIALSILLWSYGKRAIGTSSMNALSINAVASGAADILPGNLSAPAYQERFAVDEIESTYASALDGLNHAHDADEDEIPDDTEHDFISAAEVTEDLRLIDAIEIGDLSVYFNHRHEKHPQERQKRSVGVSSPAAIDKVLHDTAFPLPFRQVLQAFSEKAQNNSNVINARAEDKELMRLLAIIEEMTSFLQNKIEQHKFDSSFSQTSKALQAFWKIADETNDAFAQEVITEFKADRLKEKWELHTKRAEPSTDDRDLYIQSRYLTWQEHGIRSSDTVLSHVGNELQRYSLYDLQEHSQAHAHTAASYHFAFDNTGLPDTQLKTFAETDHAQAFLRFTESEAYFHLKAKNMWNARLHNLLNTPSGFQKTKEIQRLIDTISAAPLMTQTSKQGVIKKLLKLGLSAPALHSQDISRQVVLGYTHHRLLETPGLGQFINTDVIISFTNQFNDTEYSTIPFPELICMNADIKGINLDQYQNLKIHWPLPILNEPAIKSQLGMIQGNVKKFAATFELASEIKRKHEALIKEMPTFINTMEDAMNAICSRIGIPSCNLSDSISITYRTPKKKLDYGSLFAKSKDLSEMREFLAAVNELENHEFSYLEILKGEHRRKGVKNGLGEIILRRINRNDLSDSQKNALSDALMNFDAQAAVIDALKKIKKNPAIEAHFEDFQTLLRSQSPQKDYEGLYEFKTTPLLALLVEKPFHLLEAKIRLFSRLNGQTRDFISIAQMLYQAKNDPELAAFLKTHLPADFDGKFESLSITGVSAIECENLYLRTVDWHIKNADTLIRSQGEALIDSIAETILDNALLLTLPVLLMNPVTALVYTSLIFVGPRLMELANSDNQQDTQEHLSQVVEAVELQMAGAVASEVIAATGTLVRAGISSALESRQAELSIMRNIDDTSEDYVRDLEQEFSVSCPTRVRRAGDTVKCTIRNTPASREIVSKTNRDTETGQLAKHGWQSLRKLALRFFPDIKAIIAGEVKSIAEKKLMLVQDLIASGAYQEELELAAQAYFGEKYESIKFIEKIKKLQNGFKKLTPKNINLSAPFRSNSETVAQINLNAFNKDGEFLEVNKGNFNAYYKHMGSSMSAISDLTMHEISHATIGTMDFVYIGSRNFPNGQVDVYELINLGNNNLKTSLNEAGTSQRYVSPYGGAHLGNLRGSSADFGKTAGLQNADSITQFISLFSKATTNPEEFRREIAQLEALREKTDGFTKRISEPVLMNRSKRESKLANANGGEHFSPYIITFNQADNTIHVYMRVEKPTDTIPTAVLPYRAAEYTNGRQKWEEEQRKQQEEKNRETQRRSNPPPIVSPQSGGRSALGLAPGSSRN